MPVSSPVSAAKPTITRAGTRPVVGDPGEDVGVLLELDRRAQPSPDFLILDSLTAAGRKSAGAAAITTASAVGRRADDRVAQLAGGLDPDDLDAGRDRAA